MNLIFLFLILSFSNIFCQESLKEAAEHSRWIINNSVIGFVSTFSIKNTNYPFVSMEDFCDSYNSSGIPFFLLPTVSTTSKNILNNPNASISIALVNCSINNYDGIPYDALACSRMILSGYFSIYDKNPTSNTNDLELLKYFKCHPAAPYLIDIEHSWLFYKFNIQSIYFIGGFGNIHYIGNIDTKIYFDAQIVPPS